MPQFLRYTVGKKRFATMVKGERFCLFVIVIHAAICKFHTINGLERQIKKLVHNNNGLGTYSFEYENIDGTYRKEEGGHVSNSVGIIDFIVRGEYAYIDPAGHYHHVRYKADSQGFQPQTKNDIRYNDRKIV